MTTHTDAKAAFLEDICANPEDDAIRLIFADWLDDHDDAARAEFIRLQVRMAAEGVRRDEDVFRELELLESHGGLWAAPVAAVFGSQRCLVNYGWGGTSGIEWGWRRGFIEMISMSLEMWAKYAAALFPLTPLREYAPSARPGNHLAALRIPLRSFFMDENIGKLDTLDLTILLRDSQTLAFFRSTGGDFYRPYFYRPYFYRPWRGLRRVLLSATAGLSEEGMDSLRRTWPHIPVIERVKEDAAP